MIAHECRVGEYAMALFMYEDGETNLTRAERNWVGLAEHTKRSFISSARVFIKCIDTVQSCE